MDKKISYLSRTYEDYRNALIDYAKKYYPTLATSFNDASVGAWLVDLNAAVADELGFYIDKAFQETNINSANNRSSIFSIAKNSGLKVPGPKGAMAEVAFSCIIPVSVSQSTTALNGPDWAYAPVIKKGTRVSSGSQSFEVMDDIDFAKQFNSDGFSDRYIVPVRDSNSNIKSYRVTKKAVVVAGETKVYKKYITTNDIKPFMEILIPVESVMNVESIVVKEGSNYQSNPTAGEFMRYNDQEYTSETGNGVRFFEVDSLMQQKIWGEHSEDGETAVVYDYGYLVGDGSEEGSKIIPTYSVTKGEWKIVHHKFITEFTDNGYLKVIFGAGYDEGLNPVLDSATDFARYQISRMVNNANLGLLPNGNSTVFIQYRVGGGSSSNVAKGAINNITYKNVEFPSAPTNSNSSSSVQVANIKSSVLNSLSVENTTPSVSGKDAPSVDEIRYMIKYNSGAQERCVTVKDYVSRVLQMPPKYGVPFRVGGAEENNKIMLYVLGVDYNGNLDATLPIAEVNNITEYLSNYRSINDYVEIKSGRIINLSFEIDLFVDKNYNKSDVIAEVIRKVKNYMDINKHQMGDDIFVGDIEKEITQTDGVISIIDFRVYNEFGENYSSTQTGQEIVTNASCDSSKEYSAYRSEIDLEASEGILYSDGDCMLEVKNDEDIICRVKER